MTASSRNKILVLGAGELGTAILDAILQHPLHSSSRTPVTLLVRESSLNSPTPEKKAQLDAFRQQGISLQAADINNDSQESLSKVFADYTTVIHAGGMTSPEGTQTKITRAILDAGVKLYVPWQHGVDYDVIGPDGGFGLFREQYEIRQTLRSQTRTQWVIVSCGIFMSFLFEEFWGVVTRAEEGGVKKVKVTALNSWDDWITTTTAKDIGRCTAQLALDESEERNTPVYIAGDTLTYRDFANVVEEVTAVDVIRDVWPLAYLKEQARDDPEDKLRKYHVVFSEGKGLSWPKENTWNIKKGMQMEDIRSWMSHSFN